MDGIEQITRFISSRFSTTEIYYSIHEKKVLVAKNSIKRLWLFVISQEFTLRTDSEYLKNFMDLNLKENKSRLIRWQTWFAEYRIKFAVISKKSNLVADFLSKLKSNLILVSRNGEENYKSLFMFKMS